MSTDTANYGFKKDNEDEFYNVNVVNDNLDKIDTEMKRIEDIIPTVSPTDSVKWIGTVAGTANALTVTHAAITSYSDGLGVSFAANANSSAATTLNINSLGAIPIKKANGTVVTNLKVGGVYTLRYRGSAFILQGEGGGEVAHNSKTFTVPGSQNFIVPDGVFTLSYWMWGAGGGGGGSNGFITSPVGVLAGGGGGSGGFSCGTMEVTPGETLMINVGRGGYGGQAESSTYARQGTAGTLSYIRRYSDELYLYAYPGGGGGTPTNDVKDGRGGVGGGDTWAGGDGGMYYPSTPLLDRVGRIVRRSPKNKMKEFIYITGSGGKPGHNGGTISTIYGGGGAGSPSDIAVGSPGGAFLNNTSQTFADSQPYMGGPRGTTYMNFEGADGGSNSSSGGHGVKGGVGAGGSGGGGFISNALGGDGGDGRIIIAW